MLKGRVNILRIAPKVIFNIPKTTATKTATQNWQ